MNNIVTVLLVTILATGTDAGILDYNIMNCMEFSRHMLGTVPSRMGVFRRAEEALASIPLSRRSFATDMLDQFRQLFTHVTNVGDQNVINCMAQEPFSVCMTIDSFLEQNFPDWFFEYQVTHNFNHVVSQITDSPVHALFEAGLKAYACFCSC